MGDPAIRLAARGFTVLDTTIGGVLREAAARAPDAIALVHGVAEPSARRRWTYDALYDWACGTASILAGDVSPRERLALWAPTSPETLVVAYAAALAGLELVLVNPALRSAEVAHVLGRSGAAALVMVDEWRDLDLTDVLASVRADLPELRAVRTLADVVAAGVAADRSRVELPTVDPGDVALIVFTSGTTGAPKGARLTHRAMTNSARVGAERFGIRPGDVYVDPMPLYHVGGHFVALEILGNEATYVLVDAFDPALVIDLMEQERATLTVAVPTMLVSLLEQEGIADRDLTALRSVSSGGAVVSADLVRRVRRELGASVTVVFGQTECCGSTSQTRLDDPPELVEQTVGVPADGVDVRVVDPETGAVTELDAIGELHVRGYHVMAGYHDDPEATASTIDADGWLHTGDLVTLDADGFLRIVGRLKDMIVTGGVNVYAAEVETALESHPAVGQAAVLGLPDPHWGERVVAVLRPATGATVDSADIEAYLRERLAPYKVPKQWAVVAELPVTPYGKVRKFELRDTLVRNELA
jgi:fatty-acyl-CoA synthase